MAALAACVSACAPKKITAIPVVTMPKFPEFTMPDVPPAMAALPAAAGQDRGWRFLQAGDFKNAEREFTTVLKSSPAFYPADAALGYLELARQDAKAALPHFDRGLEREPAYVPALLGRGQTLLALGREADAVIALEAALMLNPSLTDIRRRVEVLKFRGVEQDLANARRAAAGGRLDEAISLYTRAVATSPDSAFLYRELGGLERQKNDADAALRHFRQAVALDPGDAKSLAQIGELLEGRGDLAGAEQAYTEALAIEPDAEIEAKLDNVRAGVAWAQLPPEYRAIEQSPQVTRADLAALIGIRLAPLVQARVRRDGAVITDLRNNWASAWIVAVARAGVMEPFANHAFQPRTVVRRIDLAQAVSRLLARMAAEKPAEAKAWQAARLKFSDLSAGHLAYPAASAAVAAGVMATGANNTFQPSRTVTGAEALAIIGRLEALAGLTAAAKGRGGR